MEVPQVALAIACHLFFSNSHHCHLSHASYNLLTQPVVLSPIGTECKPEGNIFENLASVVNQEPLHSQQGGLLFFCFAAKCVNALARDGGSEGQAG